MKLKVISTGSIGNAYILENENEVLLIECGVNIMDIKKALNFDFSKVVGCLVSHEHQDHAKSFDEVMRLGITTYTGSKTTQVLNPDNFHRSMTISPKQIVKIGNFKVMAFDVQHDAVEPLGFIIEHPDCGKVLFLTDTNYCKYTFPGLNNIIIEANFSKEIIDRKFGPDSDKEFLRNRILKSHFSLENCKDMLAANDLSKVNNIVLIHLSDSNSNEKQFQSEVSELTGKNVTVARKGLTIDFNITPF
ncbi:MBL fold metallo-hydrolase [Flavobacterium sp. CF136]|uniref:MBL fold metallo-hydrolase n=1 Tax=Flavobacterium sp. (strain CF136) TaxID=1144313 RepID=UPI0002717C1E|nr:MBL fold metallo-hydrolase [Flavobacterium sp. CF136]EJL66921.1 metal-dependent hydrolase, beta-lactamase superfamily I [Flavobacterium sp. CF136]